MVAEGVHAPEQVVQTEGHPRQRNVVAQVRGPHPVELRPAKPPIVGVLEEISRIVPVHKLVLQRGQEGSEGGESNEHWSLPEAPSLGQRERDRLTTLTLGQLRRVLCLKGRFQLAGLLLAAHGSGHARRSLRRGTSDSPLLSNLRDWAPRLGILRCVLRLPFLGG